MLAESLNDALIEAVKACGGSKVVGVALWPAKGIEAAQRSLLACLNADRNEKLSPDELMLIFRMARERGFHGAMHFFCADLSYSQPNPIDPKDEVAELLRQNNELRTKLLLSSERIERLLTPSLRSVP